MSGALVFDHYPIASAKVPEGWVTGEIARVAKSVTSGFPTGAHNSEGKGVPHIRPMNIDREGRFDLTVVKSVNGDTPRLLASGDVLFNNTNSPELIGKTTVILVSSPLAYSNHMTRIRLEEGMNPTFVARQLHFLWMAGYFRHRCKNHVNQASIASEPLAQTVPLLIPPIAEQQRIADTLDELLSDLDAGVAALERVQAKLKHYRAAVLKAAVEGALTAGWRDQHPDTEPVSVLLQRVLTERRGRWEGDQLEWFSAAGKKPPKNWKSKYKEPAAPDTASLPALPEGWCWTNLNSIIVAGPQNGAYYPSTLYGAGFRILRIDDFQNGWVRTTDELRQVSAASGEAKTFALVAGDLVINRVNSMTHLGKCLVVGKGLEGSLFESNMMRARLAKSVVPRLTELYLQSGIGRRRLIKGAKWAVNQASINQEDVKHTAVPLPPALEQDAIVDAVEDQLSVIDHLEADLQAKLKSAQALRQSILRHAFTGQLVPQDANDEPARELLERIAAEREERARQAAAAKQTTKKAKPAKARTKSPR